MSCIFQPVFVTTNEKMDYSVGLSVIVLSIRGLRLSREKEDFFSGTRSFTLRLWNYSRPGSGTNRLPTHPLTITVRTGTTSNPLTSAGRRLVRTLLRRPERPSGGDPGGRSATGSDARTPRRVTRSVHAACYACSRVVHYDDDGDGRSWSISVRERLTRRMNVSGREGGRW